MVPWLGGKRLGLPAAVADRTEVILRPLTLGLVVFGVIYAVGQVRGLAPLPADAQAYYGAARFGVTYPPDWQGYAYSPLFAQALWPLAQLPWLAFVFVWTVLLFTMLAAALGPWGWLVVATGFLGAVVPIPVLPSAFGSIGQGNLEVLVALVAIIGLRYPATWVTVLASKVTPGLGLVWFLVRREWRPLAIALGVTAAAVVVSVGLSPSLWPAWFGLLAERTAVPFPGAADTVPVPLWLRVVSGAALVAWGARRDARWTLPLAMGWAIPGGYPSMWMIWLAAVPLLRRRPLSGTASEVSTAPDTHVRSELRTSRA